jgi:hypothetical protein
MTTTGFPPIRSPVLLGPFELATKRVLPLFDFRNGFIKGSIATSIPFLNLAFILISSCFVSRSKQAGLVQQAIPECPEGKTGGIAAIASRTESDAR